MATWYDAHWSNDHAVGPRRDQRSGGYRAYEPDTLVGSVLALDAATDTKVATAERAIRTLNSDAHDLAGISHFLLRSEAIASSRIEGVAPSARQVAMAELGQSEDVRGVSDPARLVANNMTVVREATTRLMTIDKVAVTNVEELHRALLPDEARHHGIRTAQNWIGGSDWHPLEAEFVPPPPDRVTLLLDDLMQYVNGAAHSPVVQAAPVHAQFETIHSFSDGNGRVGRALIHTVLARRGLTNDTVLPISVALASLSSQYVAGLTEYRYDGEADSQAALAARSRWDRPLRRRSRTRRRTGRADQPGGP